MAAASAVSVARIYHLPPDHDGTRVLVDRLRPRGLRKDDAPMDLWCKEVAPPLTLLTATKTPEISHAEVLARLLREHRDRPVLSFNGR